MAERMRDRVAAVLGEYFPLGDAPFGLAAALEDLLDDVSDEAFGRGQLSMLPD